MSIEILLAFLGGARSRLKRFHLTPANRIDGEDSLRIIKRLSPDDSPNNKIKELNLKISAFDGLFEALATFYALETLYVHLSDQSQQNDLNLKSLSKIVLDFNANRSAFSMESRHSESDALLTAVLPKLPTTLTALTLSDAVISSSLFVPIVKSLPYLRDLQLMYVFLERDCEQTFWQVFFDRFHRL